ncbi:hypothetical protein QCA50_015031 [Cerrena zonata]|uniref:Uncharacterized protein n=1 Tax=Cerrena zonata TaxID=2478898 RepID=A0AAW0FS03_9APHY
MISFVILTAFLGCVFALPEFRRDEGPSVQDLFLSCPGAAGSPNVERADRCTLIDIKNNPDIRLWAILGDPQLNCGGGTQPVTITIGGSQTVTTGYSVDANIGINIEGIQIGGGASSSQSTSITTSRSTMYVVSPGRQVVQVAGILHKSQTGNVQVNYGDRVAGHYIWYTGTEVTELTPTDDVEYDTHETKCGTDPRDLNNHS